MRQQKPHFICAHVTGGNWWVIGHHESGLVAVETRGGAVLGHVCLLGGRDVLGFLRDPVGGNLQHQTLQDIWSGRSKVTAVKTSWMGRLSDDLYRPFDI